ncbi:MAG TPA: VOC family protein [Galbitalea sp.]|jgi:catechol 2,3-dioxygenase-like lactoylglutathione lyase family enzyme|nr:VOC family protein [Galbitalea sp.]
MRISTLTITASDLDAAAEYYQGLLGLRIKRDIDRFEAAVGRTTLVVRPGETAWAGIHLAMTIPRNRFAEARTWLSARTALATVDGEDEFANPNEPWCSKSLYFRGPDGIVLELITRDRLDNDSSEPFSSASLLCISEAGVASTNVAATVAALGRRFGAEPFGEGVDEFAPIGDDHGMFIVVADGRPWFSALDSRARGGPTDIRVERS